MSVFYQGYHGDLNETFVVGEVDEASKNLIKATHDCLMTAVAACKPGVRYRDMGDIISRQAGQHGWVPRLAGAARGCVDIPGLLCVEALVVYVAAACMASVCWPSA